MGVHRGFRSASAAAVAATALLVGACGGGEGGVTAKLGPVAAVPEKKRVDFGDVPVGESSSKTVTVTNGNDTPQKLTGLDVDSTSSDVTISGGTCRVGEALEPDETCTVVMTLRPPARGGSATATLTIDRTSCCGAKTRNTDNTDDTDNTGNTDGTGTDTTGTGTGNTDTTGTDTTGTGTATTEPETTPDTGTTPTTATPGG